MSKIISTMAIMFTMALAAPVQAGSGHSHDARGGHSNSGHSHGAISEKKATAKAEHKIASLIKKGKLDKSWAGVKATSARKKKFKKGEEWVVSFSNKKAKDKDKQKLYVFYSLDGHYIAANHTGK